MKRPTPILIAAIILGLNLLIALPSMYLNISNAPEELSKPVMFSFGAIYLLIQFAFIYLILSAKNWGRIVYSVLTVGGILIGITGPNSEGVHHQSVYITHWLGMGAGIIVLVLLFVPVSNAWFKNAKNTHNKSIKIAGFSNLLGQTKALLLFAIYFKRYVY